MLLLEQRILEWAVRLCRFAPIEQARFALVDHLLCHVLAGFEGTLDELCGSSDLGSGPLPLQFVAGSALLEYQKRVVMWSRSCAAIIWRLRQLDVATSVHEPSGLFLRLCEGTIFVLVHDAEALFCRCRR